MFVIKHLIMACYIMTAAALTCSATLKSTDPSVPVPVLIKGDRKVIINKYLPPSMFSALGGRVLNVKKAPFNAIADGKYRDLNLNGRSDDTDALILAYDAIAEKLETEGMEKTAGIIYLPNGTYVVDDTITYSDRIHSALVEMKRLPTAGDFSIKVTNTGNGPVLKRIKLVAGKHRFEAEQSKYVGAATTVYDSSASNGAVVGQLHDRSRGLIFNSLMPGDQLAIKYGNGGTTKTSMKLSIGSGAQEVIDFVPTGSWTSNKELILTRTISAGTSVTLMGVNGGLNIDYIEVRSSTNNVTFDSVNVTTATPTESFGGADDNITSTTMTLSFATPVSRGKSIAGTVRLSGSGNLSAQASFTDGINSGGRLAQVDTDFTGTAFRAEPLVHVLDWASWHGEVHVRIMGQDRSKTIIKLKDGAPRFQNVNSPKPVLSYRKDPRQFNNVPADNSLENITINTGKTNPGAVGLVFAGANLASLNDLTIRTLDGNGYAGIWMPVGSVQAYGHDITVEGFNIGIKLDQQAEICATFEHVSLIGQKQFGMQVQASIAIVRDLYSKNSVPAVSLTHNNGHVTLVDSLLEGGIPTIPAIKIDSSGGAFVRNVTTKGYSFGINNRGTTLFEDGNITEYTTSPPVVLFEGQADHSLNLAVPDTPYGNWEQNPLQWASPEDYDIKAGSGGDDTAAIQAALSSGRSVVYFPKRQYRSNSLTVPPTVKRIELMHVQLLRLSSPTYAPVLIVKEASSSPLVVSHSGKGSYVEAQAARDVVALGNFGFRNKQTSPIRVFLENASAGTDDQFATPGAQLWIRNLNNEYGGCEDFGGANVRVFGGKVWLLGFKTENKPHPPFWVKNGGVLEVLGGYVNEACNCDAYPLIKNENSTVSATIVTSHTDVFDTFVSETRGDVTKTLSHDKLPIRGVPHDHFMPLYVGSKQ